MSDELLLVVDENDNPLEPLPRTKVIKEGHWRRTCGILVVNPKTGSILCQKRSDTKDERPGFWISMFGGKVAAGESSEESAVRELEEEAGIAITPQQLHFFIKHKSESHYQFEYLYWTPWGGNTSRLNYDKEEVAQIDWYPIDETLQNLTNGNPDWYCYGEGELATIRHAKDIIKNKYGSRGEI